VGVIVTAGGFGFAVWQLRREYRWRRQQYAVNMLAEWNDRTAPLRRGIDAALPGLLDEFQSKKGLELNLEIAKRIYDAGAGTPDWEVKSNLIDLLNYCEYVAVSFQCQVGDNVILASAFQNTLVRWHETLAAFIEVTVARRGYDPWGEYSAFIKAIRTTGC
jgi:hypothetical protein